MRIGLFKIFLFLIYSNFLFSQTNVNAPSIIPASPNAASLGKYSEIPVSLYTGLPTIEVPLYLIQSGSLKIPLSLSYHAGGVRVEEIASNVGLGWTLTGISAVSRTIAGLDDFTPSVGFMNQSSTIDQLLANTNTQALRLDLAKIGARHYDGEPDVYSYNLGRSSGKFYYNQSSQKFIPIPYDAIKIEGDQTGFTLTTPEGISFTLSNLETTISPENSGAFVGLSNHVTTWYITQIEDLKTGDQISFEYESYLSRVFLNGSESRTDPIQEGQCNPTGNPTISASIEMREVQSLRIKKIFFKGGYVEFFKSTSTRCDLVTDYSLEKIKVFQDGNFLIKEVKLKYSYFQTGGKESNPCDEVNSRYRRLKLDEVEEVAGGRSNGKHKFYYYGDGGIPDRLGYSQDYWGFYNAGSISTNVPAVTYAGVNYPGANRNAVANLCLIGTLNEIVYPTGGKTQLIYESNTLKSPATYNANNAWSIPFEILDYTNNYYTTDYQQIIEINSPSGYIQELTVGGSGYDVSQVYNNTGNPNITLDYSITLSNANNPSVDLLAPLVNCNSSGSSGGCRTITQQSKLYKLYNVPNGTYILSGGVAYNEDPYIRSLIVEYLGSLNWFAEFTSTELNGYENKVVGGARIKEQHDFAANSNAASITKYDYSDEQGFSTALMQTYPNVDGFLYKSYSDQVLSGTVCKTLRRTSYSSYPLLYTNGSSVGYKKVKKYKVDSQGKKNGIEEFIFTSYDNAQDIVVNEVPYCPPVSNDWQRGLTLLKKDYKIESNNSTVKIAESENVYTQINNSSSSIKGVKVAFVNNVYPWVYEGQEVNSPTDLAIIQSLDMKANTYSLSSSVMKLDVVKSITFSNNLELKEENKYHYNPATLNIEREVTSNSKSEEINIYRKYSNDFGSQVYSDMFNLNILTPEIETSTFKGTDLLTKRLTSYKTITGTANNLYVIDEIKTQIKSGSLELDLKFNQYDAKGNLVELQKANNVKEVYLWGYNKQYPVAKIINTTYDIAQTYITQSVLDAATGNGDDAALLTHLNNLRSISGALVTTYTYKPLIGMTSQTDANNRTVYYVYDSFNRLTTVKDNDGKIIKKICYNYAGQIEDCDESSSPVYSSAAISASFTPTITCPQGQAAAPVFINVPLGQFTSSISQPDADAQAQAYAQQLANQQAVCFTPIYARLEVSPSYSDNTSEYYSEYDYTMYSYAQLVSAYIRFYSDAACTIPLALPNNINYSINTSGYFETESGYSFRYGNITGIAQAGNTEVFIDDMLSFEGLWGAYRENEGWLTYEKWRDDYELGSLGAGFIIRPAIYPTHSNGY